MRLPIQILISMRDDFIANIDQLEVHTRPVPRTARYHLRLLDEDRSKEAIANPGRAFDVRYEDDVLDRLVRDLSQGGDEIEPSHLQIVCERIYSQVRTRVLDSVESVTIGMADLDSLRSVRGILGGYFDRIIDSCVNQSDATKAELDRFEILSLLEPLITTGGKRNIVGRDDLVRARFRNPLLRRELLNKLVEARIVRAEYRLNGAFVEITHEFLITSIHRALDLSLSSNAGFRELESALAKLERIEKAGFRTRRAPKLNAQEI